jgi:hypothetical protein
MSPSLTYDDCWTDLVGKTFVLGQPNAKGEFIITMGGTRWQIANPHQVPAGERVRVTGQEGGDPGGLPGIKPLAFASGSEKVPCRASFHDVCR